ncbi:MAG TPA: DUF5683 domain-containing protein [Bacteroidales bacterium]|nr:DUF5683 domain-containing protein [Bacteroidales bacterium]HPT22112.1 DUF5683 domain-containing protein [Bacteroidales bacterium]
MNLFCVQLNIFAQDPLLTNKTTTQDTISVAKDKGSKTRKHKSKTLSASDKAKQKSDSLSVTKAPEQKSDTSVIVKTNGRKKDNRSVPETVNEKMDSLSVEASGKNEEDTLSSGLSPKQKFFPETMKATMMAVAFPGLGQIYNRKYWKIPVVYAGFGALVYFIQFNGSNFNKYMRAYQDFTDDIPETQSYLSIIHDNPANYDPVLYPGSYSATTASTYKDNMLRMIDYHKKYRDLSYIGIVGWYLFTILDANVDASLYNYDVSDNLDIAIFPVQVIAPGGTMYAGFNVGMKITF